MKKILALLTIGILATSSLMAQEESEPKESNWKLESIFSLNITQSSFTNWASGGRNNISGLGFINASADYSKGHWKWANQLSTGLGGIKYFDENLQKTDDLLDIQSTVSYGLKDPWYISLLGGFRTQYLNGYVDPEDPRTSAFMAPGYGNLSLGIEYIPNDNFKVLLSPLSAKFTWVQVQRLADMGAYGVEPAELDALGNVLTPGRNFRPELGAYLRVSYKKELIENINLRTRWEFFSNYLDSPDHIDVNGELILDFKINKWFSANLQLNLIYDHDIKIEDRKGNIGPRTQFKQVLGIGIAYRLANFSEQD